MINKLVTVQIATKPQRIDLPTIGFARRRVSEFRNSEAGGYEFYTLI